MEDLAIPGEPVSVDDCSEGMSHFLPVLKLVNIYSLGYYLNLKIKTKHDGMTFERRFAGIIEGKGTVAVGVSSEACYGVMVIERKNEETEKEERKVQERIERKPVSDVGF